MLRQQIASAGAILVLAGCGEVDPPTGPPVGPVKSVQSIGSVSSRVEDPLEQLSREVPQFGGLYLEPDLAAAGNPRKSRVANLYLTAGGNRAHGIDAARRFLGRNRIQLTDVRVLPAKYTYSELLAWKRQIKDVLAVEGVVMLDLDEAKNDLFIGVLSGEAEAGVRSFLRATSVPMSAVRMRVVPPIRRLSTLQDYRRPIEAGRQIEYSYYTCTLGFNASLSGSFLFATESDRTFVTASHCTDVQGGVESTSYSQGAGFIGTEIADPSYFTGGECPTSRVCRYSDAAMVKYDPSAEWDPAAIARTSSGITTSSSQPTVTFYNEATALVNSYVGKMGRTTGYTSGAVTSTCFDGNVANSNVTQLCQVVSQARSAPGDSGGPAMIFYSLFFGIPDSGWGADLYGVLWGGFGSTAFIYSPIAAVHNELGAFQAVCASDWFC